MPKTYLEDALERTKKHPVSIEHKAILDFQDQVAKLLPFEENETVTDEYGNSWTTGNIIKKLEENGMIVDKSVKNFFKGKYPVDVNTLALISSHFNCDLEIKLVKRT
jgi:hypothetical protein